MTDLQGSGLLDPSASSRRVVLALLGVVVALVTSSGLFAWATPTDRVTADEPQYLLSASSLVRGGDLDIADEVEGERFRSFHATDLPAQAFRHGDDDPLLSPHDAGLPVLLALPVGLGGWLGAKIALAATAGALAALTAWIAVVRSRVGLRLAVAVVGAFAVSAPLATYATQVYPEVPAALAVTAALAALTTPGATTVVATTLAATAVAVLPWLSLKYLPLAVVLTAGVCWTARRRLGMALAAGGVVVIAIAAALVVHHRLHGGWISFPDARPHALEDRGAVGLSSSEILGRSRRLGGLLVDEGFGLAAWAPAWLFVPFAAGAAVSCLWRRSIRPGPGLIAGQVPAVAWPLVVLAVGWLVAVFAAPTMHGWWPPGRQLVVVAPAGVLLVAWVLEARPALRMPFLVAAGLGVATWSWTTVEAVTRVRTLVLDVGATTNPWYRLWRLGLHDGRSPGVGDDVLLAAWSVLLVVIVAAGLAIGRDPRA